MARYGNRFWLAGCAPLALASAPAIAKPVCSGPLAALDQRVETVLRQMTLEEKVAQMRIFHAEQAQRGIAGAASMALAADGTVTIPAAIRERIARGIGGVKNPGELSPPRAAAAITNALQSAIMAASRQRIPALFVAEAYNGLDAEGTTKFARPIAMASTWNPQLVGNVWDVIGREARARGFHMIHSPVADIHRDPRFGRMSEGFGEDTHLTSAMVTAAVRAVQGNRDGATPFGVAPSHIGAVTKHFVGYGQVDGGRNFASVNISPRDLVDQLMPPFRAAVEQGCTLGIMPSHGDINGVASHGNRWLLTDTLRGAWGFDGYVVSDAEDVARLGFFMGVADSDEAAAKAGLVAGVDIDLYSERAYANLPAMAAGDPSLLPLIDRAAGRVLRTKMKLGLFDKALVDPAAAERASRTPAALDLALALDLEAAILLQNRGALLPLAPEAARRVALIGPLLAPGTEAAFARHFAAATRFTVEPALRLTDANAAAPRLISEADNRAGIERAVAAARQADLAILFLGDDEYTAKEAFFRDGIKGDRASLDPVGQQDALVRAVAALGKPVVVVLKHRRTLAINTIAAEADAILDMWEPGERGDEAIALLLTGRANPSGRLPVSVPRSAGNLPVHYSQKRINFKKGYLFEEDGPLFPFGHGLSYTRFGYGDLTLSAPVMRAGAPISASFTLTNQGSRAGQEVVQLYISDPVATVTRPVKELKAFQKIALAPGESRVIRFTITPDMLAHTGADMTTDPGHGAFTIEIAPSSAGGGRTANAMFAP